MVDVEQDRVEPPARRFGIEALVARRRAEEVLAHQPAPRGGGEPCRAGQQFPLMPVDDRWGALDHHQLGDPVVRERFAGGAPQAEPAASGANESSRGMADALRAALDSERITASATRERVNAAVGALLAAGPGVAPERTGRLLDLLMDALRPPAGR